MNGGNSPWIVHQIMGMEHSPEKWRFALHFFLQSYLQIHSVEFDETWYSDCSESRAVTFAYPGYFILVNI